MCSNALRLDWLSVCPPTGTGVKMVADDLFGTPLEQAEIDFVNEGGSRKRSHWTRSSRKVCLEIYLPGPTFQGAVAMSQITLYLDDATQALVDQAAQANGLSKSRWVADIIRKHAHQVWPKACLELAGKFPDFPVLEADGSAGMPDDAPRVGF